MNNSESHPTSWRVRIREIIFEADSPAGKAFDVALIATIILSVVAVMLESVHTIGAAYGRVLRTAEWVFTIAFTVEYVLRLGTVGRPRAYATSFFGIVDLLAILPTYLSVVLPGGQALIAVRALRLLRVFRVLKLAQYVSEAAVLMQGLRESRHKITVFLLTVLTLVVIIGSTIYLVEGADNGFTSIPRSIYWAVVTLTTVGYGDIAPQTTIGQALAVVVMVLGYSIIAVPAGIVTAQMRTLDRAPISTQACPECRREGHAYDAVHCKFCGAKL